MIDIEILNKLIIANVTITSMKRYFITTIERTTIYLHKDGTIHNYCGEENFFDSHKEAEDFLNMVKEEYEFIKKEEFSV